MGEDEHMRGAMVVEPAKLNEVIDKEQAAFDAKFVKPTSEEPETIIEMEAGKPPPMKFPRFKVGDVVLPKDRETAGFYVSGSTGSGKTVCQKSIMRQVRDAGQKLIIYDPAPEFVKEFWRPGDIILNPFDKRSAYWTPWCEIRQSYDYKAFSEALIPLDPKYANFCMSAQLILAALLVKTKTIDELVEASRMSAQEMEKYLVGTTAQGVITAANSKGADTVLGILRLNLPIFNFMCAPHYELQPGEEQFSVRDWVSDDDDRRWVFLVCPEDQRPQLRPLITLWFDLDARQIMTLIPNNELPAHKRRRVWMIFEELPSLPAIPSLEGLLAKGRKYGAVWMITAQDPAQLDVIYTKENAAAMLQNCNTWLIFRSNHFETAQKISNQIGQYEELEKKETLSLGVDEDRDGTSFATQRIVRDAVLPSEIQRLPNLNCYVLLYGPYPTSKVEVMFEAFKEVVPGLVMRDDINIGRVVLPAAVLATGAGVAAGATAANESDAGLLSDLDAIMGVDEKALQVKAAKLTAIEEINLDDIFK